MSTATNILTSVQKAEIENRLLNDPRRREIRDEYVATRVALLIMSEADPQRGTLIERVAQLRAEDAEIADAIIAEVAKKP